MHQLSIGLLQNSASSSCLVRVNIGKWCDSATHVKTSWKIFKLLQLILQCRITSNCIHGANVMYGMNVIYASDTAEHRRQQPSIYFFNHDQQVVVDNIGQRVEGHLRGQLWLS